MVDPMDSDYSRRLSLVDVHYSMLYFSFDLGSRFVCRLAKNFLSLCCTARDIYVYGLSVSLWLEERFRYVFIREVFNLCIRVSADVYSHLRSRNVTIIWRILGCGRVVSPWLSNIKLIVSYVTEHYYATSTGLDPRELSSLTF